jgi:hypothetical protein
MSASAIRTGTANESSTGPGGPAKPSLNVLSIFGFKGCQVDVEQFALGHHDHIETRDQLIVTENLSNQPFGSVSLDRAAKLSSGGDAKAPNGQTVRQEEDRGVTPMHPKAAIVHLFEFDALADAFGPRETCSSH